MIIGHQSVLNFFDKVIANGHLSHAYCFVGPAQVGKCTVAKHLAAKLLKVAPGKLSTQPDFILVQQELNEKTGKIKQDIDIDQIRDLGAILSRRAFLGGYKVAIIDEAEKMNANSANALLKTLEEPKGKTALFLITIDEAWLPETVRSRCQMIYFSPVGREEIEKALENEQREMRKVEEVARLATGLPGRVLTWLEDEEAYGQYKKEVARFLSLPNKPLYEKIKTVENLFGDKTDSIAARERWQSVLDLWLLLLRDQVYQCLGLSQYCVHQAEKRSAGGVKSLLSVSRRIEQAKELLRQNVHPRLAVESVLLELQ